EEEAGMKSRRIMTMDAIRSKWGSARRSAPLTQIATDPRLWAVAGALATAGGRALGRWLTRFDPRDRTILVTGGTRGPGLGAARAKPASPGLASRSAAETPTHLRARARTFPGRTRQSWRWPAT